MTAAAPVPVQNGLVLIDPNPYAYPVVTGGGVFQADLFDSLRSTFVTRLERRRIIPVANFVPSLASNSVLTLR